MSLGQALSTATAGLRVSQTALSLVASNVANAQTPGYIRKTTSQVETTAGALGIGVRIVAVNRELNQYVQKQLQTETSGGTYADLRSQFYQQLQQVYGAPGSDGAITSIYDNFTTALQALSTSPDSSSARSTVLSSAQTLAQQLNGMSADVQSLRSGAELGLSDAVSQANIALQQVAQINQKLSASSGNDTTTAVLLDQRDAAITQLSQLMDIRVLQGGNNQVTLFTGSGIQIAGMQASTLSFDAKGSLSANDVWDADPSKRSVGTLTLTSPTGAKTDLIDDKGIRSGQIAAYLEMRDQVLPEAQSQLDEIAAAVSRALSDHTTQGAAVSSGAQNGFNLDIAGLSSGNSVKITYTDAASNTQKTLTVVRVDDPSALPLASPTATPNDKTLGIDFSGGAASVAAQLNAAFGSTGLHFDNPSGSLLRVLDDGAGNRVDVNDATVTRTATSLSGGSAELPFFVDGSKLYTGDTSASGTQIAGFAGRIRVNPALTADPSKLVAYTSSTAAGDSTRPDFLYNQLTSASLDFSPGGGIGTAVAPFSGSISAYMQQMISQQGEAADAATSLQQGQSVVVNALQQRMDDDSGVNIDTEMANLLSLQTAYSANARVMTVIRDMLTQLMQS